MWRLTKWEFGYAFFAFRLRNTIARLIKVLPNPSSGKMPSPQWGHAGAMFRWRQALSTFRAASRCKSFSLASLRLCRSLSSLERARLYSPEIISSAQNAESCTPHFMQRTTSPRSSSSICLWSQSPSVAMRCCPRRCIFQCPMSMMSAMVIGSGVIDPRYGFVEHTHESGFTATKCHTHG